MSFMQKQEAKAALDQDEAHHYEMLKKAISQRPENN